LLDLCERGGTKVRSPTARCVTAGGVSTLNGSSGWQSVQPPFGCHSPESANIQSSMIDDGRCVSTVAPDQSAASTKEGNVNEMDGKFRRNGPSRNSAPQLTMTLNELTNKYANEEENYGIQSACRDCGEID
jgi:hypothetical protein